MKIILKISLPALLATYLTLYPDARPPRSGPVPAPGDSVLLARGGYLAQLTCLPCHADRDNRLTGRRMADIPRSVGQVYSSNITQDSTVGIGRWTDAELIHFLRTGARRDGSIAPAMPRYPLLADDDLRAVVAYLRSDAYPVQATATEAPPTRYSLPVRLLANQFFKPLPTPRQSLRRPDPTDDVALGRYLADGVVGCYGCHSASFRALDPLQPERSKGYYGGGNRLIGEAGKAIYSSNLTPDSATGLGRAYTRASFMRAVRLGVRPDGAPLRAPMPPHPALTDQEAGAIYAYLRTLPPHRHAVRGANKHKTIHER